MFLILIVIYLKTSYNIKMDLDLSKFNIRQTNPIILGNAGLPDNLERYTVKGEGILGIDVFKDDKINLINIEGRQELELTFFNKKGKNETLINKDLNENASFIKHILNNTNDKKSLIKKLKNKKIDLNKINSLNYFDE